MKSKSLLLIFFILLSAISFFCEDYFFARFHINTDLGVWLFAASLLVITLICLYLDKQKLPYIGLNLSIKNLRYSVIGILIAIVFTFFGIFISGLSTHIRFGINSAPDYSYILSGLFTLSFPFVAIEELLLRGFAYRKMIELTNLSITNIVFCIAVVVFHWYWWNIFGQPERMFLATITASGHLMLAYAFLKSKTIYFPFTLHLFGNWTANYLISSNLPPKSVFTIDASYAVFSSFQPYINFGIGIFVNILLMLVIYFWFGKQSRTNKAN
jgi:membrane protease YdiL (CAAX protease family)